MVYRDLKAYNLPMRFGGCGLITRPIPACHVWPGYEVHRVQYTNIRISNHRLAIETGRFIKTPRNDRKKVNQKEITTPKTEGKKLNLQLGTYT